MSYPKILTLGHKGLNELYLNDVVIEEKVDGSQFRFGVRAGELWFASKGKDQTHATDKMFAKAAETARELEPLLTEGFVYCGEYLQSPKHNVLKYDRVPDKHIILFDVERGTQDYMSRAEKEAEAARLGLEVVPCYFEGKTSDLAMIQTFLLRESVLGGAKIEGVVVKNYARFGGDGKILVGKYVSADFKEAHGKVWGEAKPGHGDVLQAIIANYTTEARWRKAVQWLKESGAYTGEPKDIGPLVKRVQEDVATECVDDIKDALWKWAHRDIERGVVRGFPQWFKAQLLDQQIVNEVKSEHSEEKESA